MTRHLATGRMALESDPGKAGSQGLLFCSWLCGDTLRGDTNRHGLSFLELCSVYPRPLLPSFLKLLLGFTEEWIKETFSLERKEQPFKKLSYKVAVVNRLLG